jgi:serine/threonine protein kinase
MQHTETERDVVRINLLAREPTREPAQEPMAPPPEGIALADLQERYEAICRTRAIYYPVTFHLRQELGRGRQGRVFLGLRQGARGCVTEHAIKLFDPRIYHSPQEYWVDMGRVAAQIAKLHSLQSPNLVFRHTYEETHGIGYSQMEAIDGLNLAELLSERHLEVARSRSTTREWSGFWTTLFRVQNGALALQPGVVIYVLRRILRGLESLHMKNFLHSDVKPSNVMIDRLGTVKLVDFGRAASAGERLSFMLGSPLYMAPELHRREPGQRPSDLYSVGLVALDMLCGRRLAEREDMDEEQLLAIKRDLPNRLTQLLPADVLKNQLLVSIIRRFIEPDPARRYTSAVEAEVGHEGLRIVDAQLVRANLDSEYERDLSAYLSKLVVEPANRVQSFAAPAPPAS